MDLTIYRHFDKDSNLLYIGRSINPLRRLYQHKKSSDWFSEVYTVTMERFDCFDDMVNAEIKAIIKEKPLYNIQHKKKESSASTKKPYHGLITQYESLTESLLGGPVYIRTLHKLSKYLDIGIPLLKKNIKDGKLDCVKIEKSYYFNKYAVLEFIDYIDSKYSSKDV